MVGPKIFFKTALKGPSALIGLIRSIHDSESFGEDLDEFTNLRKESLVNKFKVKGMTDKGAQEMGAWVFDHQSPLGPRVGNMAQGDALIWTNSITRSKYYANRPLNEVRHILYMAAGTDESVDQTLGVS